MFSSLRKINVNLYDFSLIFTMKTKYFSLVIVAIIFSMVMIVPSDMTQTADAAKASGVKNQQYGQATSNKVCGDRLCTPEDFTKEGTKKEITPTGKSSISSNIAMSKMERLFELHRVQLLSAWDSMSDSEKSHMLKMFDKMYEKMQSMNFGDHMKHMKKMMGDKYHQGCNCGPDGCDCPGCSCGDGENTDALVETVNTDALVETVNTDALVETVNTDALVETVNTLWPVKQVKDALVLKMEFAIVVQAVIVLHAINEIIPKI
jgi:hypothetical protein